MMAARIDQKGLLLGDLLAGIADVADYARCVVYGVAADSRDVTPGGLFLALAGLTTHGMQHLQQAIDGGALAVLAEPGGDWDRVRLARAAANSPVPVITVTSLGQQAGVIASRFFGQPSQAMRVIGVTGTNGKTSVAHFLANVLAQRVPTGILGTLGNGLPGKLLPSSHTTPDAVGVQAELARQLSQGVKVAAMEVSSHALDQGRVSGIAFHTAVFTNLSRDHQDYHRSMHAYAEAKARLFRRGGLMLAVVNGDDQAGAQLLQELRRRTLTIAVGSRPDTHRQGDRFIAARRLVADDSGLTVTFESSWGDGEVRSPLLGRFNAENLLLTLGVLLGWEMPLATALESLQALPPVDGRMALYGGGEVPRVVVDYAHTPDALEKVLHSLREHVRGRLICVFGCGGERDSGKRPLMGEVAQRLADRVLITDDNPRREDGDTIVAQILDGMRQDRRVGVERDRARAIRDAIAAAGRDDLVLVAGKGHEDYQLVGDLRLNFSDREQVLKALQEYPA
jgi:UDP-N-acetylmuramoyl-L-alanyl-D-glutamate--2,6-diaminopimelate ligase